MKKVRTLSILNLVFYVIAFATSSLSQFGIFGGLTNQEVSAMHETLFTPAGFTFSIWGVIYLSLFGFCIYHLIKAYKSEVHDEPSQNVLRIGNWFIINNIATACWVFAFAYELLLLSALLILIQLVSLLIIFINLNLLDKNQTFDSKLFTAFPLTIYFAWICVASIANISLYLDAISWGGFGLQAETWAIIMYSVTFLLTIFILARRSNPFFGLVVIWALYGILQKREADQMVHQNLITLLWAYLAILALLTIYQFYKLAVFKKHQLNA